MPPPPGLDALRAALGALPPRSAHLLACRLLEGRSLADCARLYGVSEEAFAIHQLRATRALAEHLGWAAASPAWSDAEEARLALGLDRALDTPTPGGSGPEAGLAPLVELARQLRSEAGPLKAALLAAEAAEARSPQRRREERLRLVAVVALVLLTLYFLLRQEG